MMGNGGMKLREKKSQNPCCDACFDSNTKLQMLTHLSMQLVLKCSAGANNQGYAVIPVEHTDHA